MGDTDIWSGHRPLVCYHSQIARMTVTPGIHRIGGQELAFFVHNKLGREMLALPERDVRYAPGSMGLHQIHLHRPSYINGLLIQSRGRREMRACTACQGSTGLRPFTECARLPGHFGGEGIFHFMIKLKKSHYVKQASDKLQISLLQILDSDKLRPQSIIRSSNSYLAVVFGTTKIGERAQRKLEKIEFSFERKSVKKLIYNFGDTSVGRN